MRISLSTVASLALVAAVSAPARAGDITPPAGPVAPTMKTIQEAEPRTPISQADIPLTILKPGSYYLTENLYAANLNDPFVIEIAADDVTLDLRGFRIEGTTEVTFANHGVDVDFQAENSVIRNGTITRCQARGIHAQSSNFVIVENMRLTFNGDDGVAVGSRSRISDSVAYGNGRDGFTALGSGTMFLNCIAEANDLDGLDTGASSVVDNCTATENGRFGFIISAGSTARNSTAIQNTEDGFFTIGGSVTTGCTAYLNKKSGFRCNSRATFVQCSSLSNDMHGFELADSATVINCVANSNNNSGFELAEGVNSCRLDGNSATGNSIGFNIVGTNNVIVRNNASGNPASNYAVAVPNVYGPLVSSGNVGGSSNPHANYSH